MQFHNGGHRTSENGGVHTSLLGLDGMPQLGMGALPMMNMPMMGTSLMPVMMPAELQGGGYAPLQMSMGGLTHPQQAQQLQLQQQQHQHHLHLQQQQQQQQQLAQMPKPEPGLAPLCAAGPVSPGSDATRLGVPTPNGVGAAADPLILQGHQSNDSIMLQQIMDQILDDDDVLSDPAMSKQLLGSPTSSPLLHAHISGGGSSGPLDADQGGMGRSTTWPHAWPGADGNSSAPAADSTLLAAQPQQLHGMVPVDGQQQAYQVPGAVGRAGSAHLPPRTPGAWGHAAAAPGSALAVSVPEPAFCHPSRRVSTGDITAAPAESLAGGVLPPTPQPQQPQMMRMLCAQLQQENMMLMQRVHSLQERLVPGDALGGGMPVGTSDWHATA